jgi:hypothetical protein
VEGDERAASAYNEKSRKRKQGAEIRILCGGGKVSSVAKLLPVLLSLLSN